MSARILALFFSLLTLVNLLGDWLWPGFDAHLWWISFGPAPLWLAKAALAVFAVSMLVFAARSPRLGRRSRVIVGVALIFALVAFANAVSFYRLLARGEIIAGFPIPLSLPIGLALCWIARTAWKAGDRRAQSPAFWKVAAGAGALFAVFPLALMVFFGNTDYRQPADAVIVFGARVYADGRLSDALEDRIRAACDLYRAGLAKRLVLSGGPGNGAVTEAEAMRRYALNHGVRAEDIFLDDRGLNTEATVRNAAPLLRTWHARRVLAVSHFYHLPRIKLAAQRAGFDVRTVPAHQRHWLGQLPFNMAREVPAFWKYYLRQRPVAAITSGNRA